MRTYAAVDIELDDADTAELDAVQQHSRPFG